MDAGVEPCDCHRPSPAYGPHDPDCCWWEWYTSNILFNRAPRCSGCGARKEQGCKCPTENV